MRTRPSGSLIGQNLTEFREPLAVIPLGDITGLRISDDGHWLIALLSCGPHTDMAIARAYDSTTLPHLMESVAQAVAADRDRVIQIVGDPAQMETPRLKWWGKQTLE